MIKSLGSQVRLIPNSVFKKVPILEKLNPDMDYVAYEEEQLSQYSTTPAQPSPALQQNMTDTWHGMARYNISTHVETPL